MPIKRQKENLMKESKEPRFPERDNSNTYKRSAIVIGILLIIAIIVASLRCCGTETLKGDDTTSSDTTAVLISIPDIGDSNDITADSDAPAPGIIYDTGAVEGGWETTDPDKIVENLNEKVAEGMINISMNTSPYFADGTASGNLMIVNESINRYPQVVEIRRNDTDELIYKSGAIPVGSKIEKAPLSVDLAAGTYDCTAMFYNVDPNSGAYLGCAGAIVQITVQN